MTAKEIAPVLFFGTFLPTAAAEASEPKHSASDLGTVGNHALQKDFRPRPIRQVEAESEVAPRPEGSDQDPKVLAATAPASDPEEKSEIPASPDAEKGSSNPLGPPDLL